jgi:integrase
MKETNYVESNPVINTFKAGAEQSRTRVLGDPEIRLLWDALDDDAFGDIVRLLLLTGQRLNEIGGLAWEEVEFDRNRIVLAKERVKNGRPHAIPMSGSVRAILEARHAQRVDRDVLVFNFRISSFARARLGERIEKANGAACGDRCRRLRGRRLSSRSSARRR